MCCYFSIVRKFAEILRILLFFTRPISDIFVTFIYSHLMGKSKELPPIEDKILLMSATELADSIRKRELNSEDVVKAYIQRSRAIHPNINAVVDDMYDVALNKARVVDHYLNTCEIDVDELSRTKPLLGVPFSCAESIGVKGMIQSYGVVQGKVRRAENDSKSASLYNKAGAINLTVTNVPEFCLLFSTANHVFGRTKNPYDVTREVGGNSGGEAAIISSAGALIGIGTDLAGNIRVSASFCGIYAHKPTTGLITNQGIYLEKEAQRKNLYDYTCVGPMCRYVEDLPLLFKVLLGDDKRIDMNKEVNFRNIKIYYLEELPGIFQSSVYDVKKAVIKAANHFKEKYDVKPALLKINKLMYAIDMWECKILEKKAPPFIKSLSVSGEKVHLVWELCKCLFGASRYSFPTLFYAATERRIKDIVYYQNLERFKELEQTLSDIFEEDAILLLPTHPEPPPHYLMSIPKYSNFGYTAIFNVLGLPVTEIPAGLSCGLPIGIQAVSGKFKDHLTIAAAQELDHVFNGWKSPSFINI